jgi:hypothetical protein
VDCRAEIEAVLDDPVSADAPAARGVRLRPSYTERLSFVAGYGQEVRDKVLAPAAPDARRDLEIAFEL